MGSNSSDPTLRYAEAATEGSLDRVVRSFMRPNCNREAAVDDFHRLRVAEPTLGRSNIGSCAVDYGTFAERFRARRQGKAHSPLDLCRDSVKLAAVHRRAAASGRPLSDFAGLYCGLVASFRPMTAKWLVTRFGATRVLDPCAGWGGRMLGAMAADVHYIGIDSNVDLHAGYDRLLRLVSPHSYSEVHMIFRPAETIDFASLPSYDCIITSPPSVESTGREWYPHSPVYRDTATEFIVPVLGRAFRGLKKNGWMCLSVPDDETGRALIEQFGEPRETHRRALVDKWPQHNTTKFEAIFCWQRR